MIAKETTVEGYRRKIASCMLVQMVQTLKELEDEGLLEHFLYLNGESIDKLKTLLEID